VSRAEEQPQASLHSLALRSSGLQSVAGSRAASIARACSWGGPTHRKLATPAATKLIAQKFEAARVAVCVGYPAHERRTYRHPGGTREAEQPADRSESLESQRLRLHHRHHRSRRRPVETRCNYVDRQQPDAMAHIQEQNSGYIQASEAQHERIPAAHSIAH